MKKSIALEGVTSSIRSGMMGVPLLAALPTSLITCGELFELEDNTKTRTGLPSMASTIISAQSAPAKTSRGAIQHFMCLDSSAAHTASAIALSREA